jgi:methionyl-tRNA synthetase
MTKETSKTLVVTYALPYANGEIHLGHMLGFIQTDIWVRFQKTAKQKKCLFFSGTDAHGTPIMLSAQKQKITPEAFLDDMHPKHAQVIQKFLVAFDDFYTTHSKENTHFAQTIYQKLEAGGHIAKRDIKQAYDEKAGMFLPDRFIKGACPKCNTPDQYGDHCDACGASYDITDLKQPYSVLTQTTPTERTSEHYFFTLSQQQALLSDWLDKASLQTPVQNKLKEWLGDAMSDWDISRDAPYFGIPIPNTKDKFFYVWLDAPIGYMSTTEHFLNTHLHEAPVSFKAIWEEDKTTEVIHFVGKDIIYFHGLFWPAMLKCAGYRQPNALYAHGFLNINGQKMSKSKGTFITAQAYLDKLPPEYLRYYFASKLNPSLEDINLDWEDFAQKINADLVGKIVNLASRTAPFIHKHFNSTLSTQIAEPDLWAAWLTRGDIIETLYEARKYHQAIQAILSIADEANQYVAQMAPWKMIKEADQQGACHDVCSMALHAFRLVMTYLTPVMPELSQKTATLFKLETLSWIERNQPLLGQSINPFEHMVSRIKAEDMPTNP